MTVDTMKQTPPSLRRAPAGIEPVRAGFIGTGNFVSGNHLPNAAQSKLWTIHGICDIDETNRTRAADRYKPTFVTTAYEELLANDEIEVIFIGTRHQQHEKFICEAAAAGKDIFVEKPMSCTWDESRNMVEAVRAAGVRLMVGFNRRFSPAIQRAKTVYQAQNAGKPAMLTLRVVDDMRLWPDWPFDLADGGGKILAEACHFYDLACWFLEKEPCRIFACGGRSDNNVITLEFPDGSTACIISSGWGSVAYPKELLEVFCDSTTLVLEQHMTLHTDGYGPAQPATERFPLKQDAYPDLGADDTIDGYRAKMRQYLTDGPTAEEHERKSYYERIPSVEKGHFHELEAYATAIRAGQPSPCSEVDGARATAIALKAIESLESRSVSVPIDGKDYFL